jgi:hypothetical protein
VRRSGYGVGFMSGAPSEGEAGQRAAQGYELSPSNGPECGNDDLFRYPGVRGRDVRQEELSGRHPEIV